MALTKIQLSELLATYGTMLTAKQREVVAMYCDCDCTLSEIAVEHGISRQGVQDTILKAENALVNYENNLALARFVRQVNVAIQGGKDDQVVQIVKKFVGKE